MRTTTTSPFTAATNHFAYAQAFTAPASTHAARERHFLPRLRRRSAR